MDAIQTPRIRELKSELARHCLPAAARDPDRNLAWVNSLCLLYLLIGIAGAKPGRIELRQPPPIEQPVAIVIQQPPPPPERVTAQKVQEQNMRDTPEARPVVVVTPPSPSIVFSVPQVGNLLVPNAIAVAPVSSARMETTPVRVPVARINSTGSGGERPAPPYPQIAHDLAEQGTVLLSMTVDASGTITDIRVEKSSGSAVLDRSAMDFVKRHWLLPPGEPGRIFEAPIAYLLQ